MYQLSVNGLMHSLDLPGDKTLLWVLREDLGLTGTKYGCGQALCGACTVHLDGEPVRSCVLPLSAVDGRAVHTIEAMAEDPVGAKVQRCWQQGNVPQCGYCQSGQIMAATALLKHSPQPSDRQIDEALSGNLCRCGTYVRIRQAIHSAAGD